MCAIAVHTQLHSAFAAVHDDVRFDAEFSLVHFGDCRCHCRNQEIQHVVPDVGCSNATEPACRRLEPEENVTRNLGGSVVASNILEYKTACGKSQSLLQLMFVDATCAFCAAASASSLETSEKQMLRHRLSGSQ